ncbi:gamma carbonic anhydrase family protein [Prosthecobacter sp.]|uniref:gamma carbonic anhydrase family protein n=1 Tax=Prosthecobacter sp. TaxID=1965333 RepID=UPI0037837F1D
MYPLKKFLLSESQPAVGEEVFIAPGAVVLGAVEMGAQSSVWYGAVLRGDINRIVVGAQSNVQDGSVLHVSDDHACVLGERVTVGHRAVVHACTVGDEVLVGMGAIILDGAQIGARSTIAAGALVTKNTVIPEGSLVVGSPARVVRTLSAEEQRANGQLALKYVEVSRRYREMGLGGGVVEVPKTATNA